MEIIKVIADIGSYIFFSIGGFYIAKEGLRMLKNKK